MGARVRLSALVILILGGWGAVVPFVGPYFGFGAGGVSHAWAWREWFGTLAVAAGAAAVAGSLAMLSARRAVARLGSWLALAAGAWFVTGPAFDPLWSSAPISPAGGDWPAVARRLGYHEGVGVLVVALACYALGAIAAGRRIEREPAPPPPPQEPEDEPAVEPELIRTG